MIQKRKYIFIPLLLLALFVTYQASITVFSHIHYVNGVMIVHSHPSSDDEHTHTERQILTLAYVSHWTGVEPVCMALEEAAFSVCESVECKCESWALSDSCLHCISLRAPPFC